MTVGVGVIDGRRASEDAVRRLARVAAGWGSNRRMRDAGYDMRDVDGKRINQLLDEERYREAEKLIRAELKHDPESHWLLITLSSALYEQRRYRLAMRYAERAIEIMPTCPLVFWHCAGVSEMLGMEDAAIILYQALLREGMRGLALNYCYEGPGKTRTLLNDCRYRLARCYKDLGRRQEARRYYRLYLRHRRQHVKSIYRVADVRRELTELEAQLRPASSTRRRRGTRKRATTPRRGD
jgi:tetratricopeptide (TPR) repeat protein